LSTIRAVRTKLNDELCNTPAAKDRLYNYIARQVIDQIPFEHAKTAIELVVDKSKNKKGVAHFNNYLLGQLQGRMDPRASLVIRHQYSHDDHGLSAADLFCWGIYRRWERTDEEWYAVYRDKVLVNETYL